MWNTSKIPVSGAGRVVAHTKAKTPVAPLGDLPRELAGALEFSQQAARVLKVAVPCGGQTDDPLLIAHKYVKTELGLERLDLFRHRRLRDAEAACSAMKTQLLADNHEVLEATQIHTRQGAVVLLVKVVRPGLLARFQIGLIRPTELIAQISGSTGILETKTLRICA